MQHCTIPLRENYWLSYSKYYCIVSLVVIGSLYVPIGNFVQKSPCKHFTTGTISCLCTCSSDRGHLTRSSRPRCASSPPSPPAGSTCRPFRGPACGLCWFRSKPSWLGCSDLAGASCKRPLFCCPYRSTRRLQKNRFESSLFATPIRYFIYD